MYETCLGCISFKNAQSVLDQHEICIYVQFSLYWYLFWFSPITKEVLFNYAVYVFLFCLKPEIMTVESQRLVRCSMRKSNMTKKLSNIFKMYSTLTRNWDTLTRNMDTLSKNLDTPTSKRWRYNLLTNISLEQSEIWK